MTLRRTLRLLTRGGLALALAVPLAVSPMLVSSADARPTGHHPRAGAAGPSHIDLPDGFAPEGIAIARDTAYLGSRVNGDLYRVDLRTGRGTVFSQGPGTPSLGLKVDRGLLYVAGGTSGTGRIVDARTGVVLRSITFKAKAEGRPTFVNDVILTRDAAWFTDSLQAQLYRVPLLRAAKHRHHDKQQGKPHGHGGSTASTLALTGDWKQVRDVNNANGITRTPDGKALIVVQSATGFLFRVDPRTGVAAKINLGAETVPAGDGLLLRGRTLYVVQNRENTVAEISLNRSGSAGTVQRRLTSDDFDVPTTVAARGNSLYLPNARFSTPQTATTEYWITRIRA